MADPMMQDDPQPSQSVGARLQRNLRKLRESGAPRERIQEEIDKAQAAMDRQSKGERTVADKIGAGAQAFSDASTLGLGGLADDAVTAAVSPGGFRENFRGNREFREENKDTLPSGVRTGLEIAGSLATPIPGGRIIKAAPKTAGLLTRFGRSAAVDAAVQGGAAAGVNAFDDASLEGVGDAAKSALKGASVAGGVSGVVAPVARGVGRTVSRLKDMKGLDKKALEIDESISKASSKSYKVAEDEAVTTAPIQRVLSDDPLISGFAKDIRSEAEYQGRKMNDAEVAMAVYRRLSQTERRAQAAINRADEYKPELTEGTLENLRTAKERLLAAVEDPGVEGVAGIPSLRNAIQERATMEGEREAFERGADVASSVGKGRNLPAKKLLRDSKGAMLREIKGSTFPRYPGYTKGQSEAALAGVMGRTPEAAQITGNPFSGFGLLPSAVKLPLQLYRNGPIIRALEERAGRTDVGGAAGDTFTAALARMLGQQDYEP